MVNNTKTPIKHKKIFLACIYYYYTGLRQKLLSMATLLVLSLRAPPRAGRGNLTSRVIASDWQGARQSIDCFVAAAPRNDIVRKFSILFFPHQITSPAGNRQHAAAEIGQAMADLAAFFLFAN